MTFRKGDKILTEEGEVGEILFVDRSGLEAQVALTRRNVKIRTESMQRFDSSQTSPPTSYSGGHGKNS